MPSLKQLQSMPVTTLAVVSFALFMDYFLYGMAAPLAAVSAAKIEDEALLGVTYGAYAFGLFVMTPILGIVTDRVGRKKPMLWGICCQVIATALLAHGAFFPELVAARLLQGAAAACTWTAGLSMIAESYHEKRVQAMGIAMIGSTAGSVLGPTLAGILYDQGGYTLPFIVAGCLVAIDFTMRFVLLPSHAGTTKPGENLRPIITDKSVISAAFAVALAGASWALMEPLVPGHIRKMAGATPGTFGILFTLATIVYGCCAPIVSSVSEKFGVQRTICFGLLMTAAMLPMLAFTNSVITVGIVLCLVSIAYAFTLNPTSAELANAVDRKGSTSYSVAYAIYNLAYSFGMISSDALVAAAAHRLSLLQTLLITSGLFVFCIPLFISRRESGAPANSGIPVAAPIQEEEKA